MRQLPLLTVVCTLLTLIASCNSDKPPIAPAVELRDSIPAMTTYGVSKLISDSGVIRYKLIAEEWKVYDRTNPPRQTFNKGLLMEKFNEQFHIQMFITADTAYWYNQNLWELRGRVTVWNEDGVRFRSELLYWDMNRHEFYSNKYSHLITPDREVKGHSFRSNEQMTLYEVNISQAAFPLPESANNDNENAEGDTTQTVVETKEPPVLTAEPKKSVRTPVEPGDSLPPNGHFK